MILQKIVLKNFKSYCGENEFSFVRGLNIISGSVGSGKTSLFEAFQWLLERNEGDFVDGDFILNKAAELESTDNGVNQIEAQVTLYFNHDEIEYKLSKKVSYNITKTSCIGKSPEFELGYIDSITGNYMPDDNAESVKYKIATYFFPQKIRDYILFKGENLNSLIDFNNSDTLRNAVDRISYLKYFENIHETVNAVKHKLVSKIQNSLRANNKTEKEFNAAHLDLIKYTSDKDNAEVKLKNVVDEINRLISLKERDLATINTLGEYPALKEKLSSVKNSLAILLNNREDLLENFRQSFIKDFMIYGFDDVLTNCDKLFQEYEEEKNKKIEAGKSALRLGVPGDALINKMLQENNCNICGRDFEPDSPESERVQSHLDKNKKTLASLLSEEERYLDMRINDLWNSISTIKSQQNDSKSNYLKFAKRFAINVEDIENLSLEEKDVKDNIASLLAKNRNLSELDSKNIRHRFKETDRQLTHKIGIQKSIENQINTFNQLIKQAEARKVKNSSNSNTVEQSFENKALKYLEELENITKKQIIEEKLNFINQIEDQANKIQESIIKNPNLVVLYSKIDRDNYTIDFVDKNGNPNPGHGAQNDLAKLSIISAVLKLSSVKSNEVFPFIVDAPASAFDDTIYKPFIESLAQNFEQSLVILKDIDKEINYYVKQDYTKNIYQLNKMVFNEDIASMTSSVTQINKLK